MKFSEKGIMSCAGSIRGAIAFGLAISIDTPNLKNKQVLVNTTLILVFFTTIVFGALMPFFIKFFKSFDEEKLKHNNAKNDHAVEEPKEINEIFTYMHPNFIEDNIGEVKEKDNKVLKNRLSYWLGTYWVEFDFVYMKPRLVHNWPQVKDDNDQIAQKIKEAIDEFNRNKIKESEPESGLVSALENFREQKEDEVIHPIAHNSVDSPPDVNSMFKGLNVKKFNI